MVRFALFIVLICFSLPAHAGTDGSQLRFKNKDGSGFTDAPGIASEMDVDVHGVIGRVRVIQYFANDTDDWQEGKYTYPLPESAAVDRLVMMVGDRRTIGFVAQKEKARQIYEQAKRQGKVTSLVEQHRDNVFHTSVANIPPRSLIAIEIAYQFDVAIDHGKFSMRVPMAITPRYDSFSPEDFITLASAEQGRASRELTERLALFDFENGNNPFSLNVSLDTGFEIKKIDSPSHKVRSFVKDGVMQINTDNPILKGEQDFVLEWSAGTLKSALSFLHSETIDGNVYSNLVVVPSEMAAVDKDKARPRQVTLVIDVSGSMAGPSIKQAKAALIEAVDDLGDDDYFNLISFESKTQWLFDGPVPASRENRKKALKWIAKLNADGGTEMFPAVERALGEAHIGERLRQVVFITDGAVGYADKLATYIREHVGDARFYAVGIGAAPNTHIMKLIAMNGRGTATYIGDIGETEDKMRALFKKMKTPVLTDLVLNVPDGIKAEIIPQRIPDLMAGEPLHVAVKSDRALNDLSFAGWQGGKHHTFRVKASGKEADGVGRLYARRKIREIKYAGLVDNADEREKLITALALEHQIMSDYTSFVAVDEKIVREQGMPLVFKRYNPNLPKGWTLGEFDANAAAQAYDRHLQSEKESDKSQKDRNHDINLPQTATNWFMQLMIGLLMMATAILIWRKEGSYAA